MIPPHSHPQFPRANTVTTIWTHIAYRGYANMHGDFFFLGGGAERVMKSTSYYTCRSVGQIKL